MAVFKCKMCGGALEIQDGATIVECEYCGTKQTLPKLDNEKRANLYDRANHFRRNNEFDRAMGIYEQILNEDNSDAEAYWSLVLCRYGIEYVEDPVSHKRVPTVNRAQFTSIFADNDYQSALQHADYDQKSVYESEAEAIDETQKGILAISQKEEPFDVFICYKETDNAGRRTPDSVLANDLYHQLTQEGFKVFFSRITLEDKLGSAYEPYIFAALNSAKVMVVLGTKPEYFNAVWVKNEWSRYLALIRNGAKKMLIPAYKDMDPYDLPEEFSHLQAQDLSRLGFMQDLIRGIKKITGMEDIKTSETKETVVSGNNGAIAPLLKRAFMFLEDGDWNSANEYCEKVLDIDPECAEAYLGKLMAQLRVRNQEELKNQNNPFNDNNNYKKALRFADDKLKSSLAGYIEYINMRNEHTRIDSIYNTAKGAMNEATTEFAYEEAAYQFETISQYLDSASLAQKCHEKAEYVRKDAILSEGKTKMTGEDFSDYEVAIELFESISGWKDADEMIYTCQKKIEEIKATAEAERLARERQEEIDRKEAEIRTKRNKKIISITAPIICVLIALIIVLNTVIIPKNKYNEALALMDSGNIIEAYETLITIVGYKDSAEKANSIYVEYEVEKIKKAKVGDYVVFGAYEQDNNTRNGKEKIEWLVLDVKDEKVLVISKDALYCLPHDASNIYNVWSISKIRTWLNKVFIEYAFINKETERIPIVTVSADKNPEYGTDPGPATQDRVFLLSIKEANKYFADDFARQCKPTAYAIAEGADPFSGSGNCMWWLRTPGRDNDFAAVVFDDGHIDEDGAIVGHSYCAVRPAMWIDLNA